MQQAHHGAVTSALTPEQRDLLLKGRLLLRVRRWLNWALIGIVTAIVIDLMVVGIMSSNWASSVAAVLVGGVGLGSRPYQLRRISSGLRGVDAQLADLKNEV